jgi:hypothetical protein
MNTNYAVFGQAHYIRFQDIGPPHGEDEVYLELPEVS